ncbi:recombinase family protein [Clostridioides difficile]|uniref:recombinase family protein n=1 Tax=Clostridioides difficile TaxID=1496 RepID=UPI0020C334AD|nr:recombinase family protein [Clostridioides difficile]MCP8421223.1 recombinase family protein [Clostridioides difficile]
MVYGYARCSTDETKQNIDRQVKELKELGAKKENIYLEYESGTKLDRVELNRLLEKVKPGDTIVATEVSRITRSTKQLCDILELAQEKKLKLILGGFVVDCTTELDPMTEGMLKMMGVFAEMERNMISQRVKSGMANAKAKGKQIGRRTTTSDDIPTIFMKHYPKYKLGVEEREKGIDSKDRRGINISELSRLCKMSRTTVYKYIKIIENDYEL